MIKYLFFSSLILNAGLLLGRLSGFIRESFLASVFGVGADSDVLVLMLTIPDTLVNILMGGALGVALVPEFVKRKKCAKKLLYQSHLFFGTVFLLIAVFLFFCMDLLISIMAPGFSGEQLEKTIQGVRWVIWLIPLTILAGITTAYLHSREHFLVPAMGTLMMNGFIVLGLFLVNQGLGGIYLLAMFMLAGGLARWFSQILISGRLQFTPLASMTPLLIHTGLIVRYVQAVLSGSALLLFPLVARSFATYFGDGSISLLNYSMKLVEFPLALTVTFLSVILFPKLSKTFHEDLDFHCKLVKYGTQLTLLLSVVACSALSAVSFSYSTMVFGYGLVTEQNILAISSMVSVCMLLLPLMGGATFLTAVFNSRGDTKTPLLINAFGLTFFFALCYLFAHDSKLLMIIKFMIISYGLICFLLVLFLKSKQTILTIFDLRFLALIVVVSLLVYSFSFKFQVQGIQHWLVLLLSGVISLFSLFAAILMNNEIRSKVIMKIRSL